MTRDEILAMPAGRELDTLVAENVMGETKPIYAHEPGHLLAIKHGSWYCLPEFDKGDECEWRAQSFSSDISAAWEVVEKLKEFKPIINYDPFHKKWFVRFNGGEFHSAEVAPLAICRASLLAVLEDK